MFSILKRKYIDVFCYTNSTHAYEYYPIRKARDFIPQWWKDIPKSVYMNNSAYQTRGSLAKTMKRCPGIIEYYKKGFMIPTWTESEFIVDNNKGIKAFTADGTIIESHDSFQKGEFLSSGDWVNIKILSPWYIETNQPLDFLYMQPHWNFNNLNKNLLIPNGCTSFYKGNHLTHIQSFISTRFNETINIKPGMPILHLVPLTEKKVKIHTIYDENRVNILDKKSEQHTFDSKYYEKNNSTLFNKL